MHRTPPDLPKFGYLFESGGEIVGVILLIFSSIPGAKPATKMRCNVSSWYVEPAYRGHASLLISQAIKHKNVTYVNISPAMHTRPIVEAQGFSRYSNGQFVAAPALSMTNPGDVKVIGVQTRPQVHLESAELDLLLAHREHGCTSLWAVTPERAYPFVFMPRVAKGIVPCAQLIYCRHIDDFITLARPIGRYLAARGRPLVLIFERSDPGLGRQIYRRQGAQILQGTRPAAFRRHRLHRGRAVRTLMHYCEDIVSQRRRSRVDD